MNILENFLNLVEKLDNKREAYLEAQEREMVEYIKMHGTHHIPATGAVLLKSKTAWNWNSEEG